jgi:hypothetical protein
MSLDTARQEIQNLMLTVGKAGLNAQFPNEFELYVFAIELVNSNKNTENYFVFPVNPSSISDSSTFIANVQQTFGGVSVTNTDLFVPTDVTINGNFGRSLKFLMDQDLVNFRALNFNITDINDRVFSERIKTGYGCYKTLEKIINKSVTLDPYGKPYSLYFYNLALNNSYLVQAMNLTPSMNQSSNMIWEYSLTLKSLLPVERSALQNDKGLPNLLVPTAVVQGAAQGVLNSLKKIISNR